MAFKHLDMAVFDDSTGFKLLKYVNERNNCAKERRGRLFQTVVDSDIDYSIRLKPINGNKSPKPTKKNDKIIPTTANDSENRSSLFKPTFVSTPFASIPIKVTRQNNALNNVIPGVQMLPPSPEEAVETPKSPEPPPLPTASKTPNKSCAKEKDDPQPIYPDLDEVRKSMPGRITLVPVEKLTSALLDKENQAENPVPVPTSPPPEQMPQCQVQITPLSHHAAASTRSSRRIISTVPSPHKTRGPQYDLDDHSISVQETFKPPTRNKSILKGDNKSRKEPESRRETKNHSNYPSPSRVSFKVPKRISRVSKKMSEVFKNPTSTPIEQSINQTSKRRLYSAAHELESIPSPAVSFNGSVVDQIHDDWAEEVPETQEPVQSVENGRKSMKERSRRNATSIPEEHHSEEENVQKVQRGRKSTKENRSRRNASPVQEVEEEIHSEVEESVQNINPTPIRDNRRRNVSPEREEEVEEIVEVPESQECVQSGARNRKSIKENKSRRQDNPESENELHCEVEKTLQKMLSPTRPERRELHSSREDIRSEVEENISTRKSNKSQKSKKAPPKAQDTLDSVPPALDEGVFKKPAPPKRKKKTNRTIDTSWNSTSDIRRSSRERKQPSKYIIPFFVQNDSFLMKNIDRQIKEMEENKLRPKPKEKHKSSKTGKKLPQKKKLDATATSNVTKKPTKNKKRKSPSKGSSVLRSNPESSIELEKHVMDDEPESQNKIRNNNAFDQRDPSPTPSTCSNFSACSQVSKMIDITDTNSVTPLLLQNKEKAVYQKITGGHVYTYNDFERGVIVLDSYKPKAKVKKTNLSLNIVAGSVHVELLNENRSVQLSEREMITIPVGEKYIMKNLNTTPSTLFFSWK